MKVIFMNTDFGIGGAKRLMLDAATALHNCGHQVHFVTIRLPKDQFPELQAFKNSKKLSNNYLLKN